MRRNLSALSKRLTAGLLAVLLTFTSVDLPARANEAEEYYSLNDVSDNSFVSGNDSDENVTDENDALIDDEEIDETEDILDIEDSAEDKNAVVKEYYGGYQDIDKDHNAPVHDPSLNENLYNEITLPEKYNNTKEALIAADYPETRTQSPWGSCWAHAAIATAEISLIKQGKANSTVDYSELALAYFFYNNKDLSDPLGGTKGDYSEMNLTASEMEEGMTFGNTTYDMNYLQRGGNNALTWRSLAAWMGPVQETPDLVYPTYDNYLPEDPSPVHAYEHEVILTDVRIFNPKEERDAIKYAIYENGSVAISFRADDTYYSDEFNSFYCSDDSLSMNHAVVLVGWDDTFSKNNFKPDNGNLPEGDGAWLVRNSWFSPSYYDITEPFFDYNGYFWISYYDAVLNESNMYEQIFTTGDTYDNNYQYDGGVNYYYIESNKVANIFTAAGGSDKETLKAVAFTATSFADVEYTIDVYKNVSEDAPESGDKVSTVSGTTDYPGYYTIELPEAVELESGCRFSVVITTKGEKYIDFEENYSESDWWIRTHAKKYSHQSYINTSGSWKDFKDTNYSNYGNACIKAFTVNGEPIPAGSYRIKFDGNGSTSGEMGYQDAETGKWVNLKENTFTRQGYYFKGWSLYKDGEAKYKDNEMVKDLAGERTCITLYALWQDYTYDICYTANLATQGELRIDRNLKSSDVITLPENWFKRTGYKFAGWELGYKLYQPGDKLICPVRYNNSQVFIYARWEPMKINVKFSAEGASISSSSLTVSYDSIYGELPIATKTGSNFLGWFTKKDGGYLVTEDTLCTETRDITLYARWYTEKYTVYFEPGEGTCEVSQIEVFKGYTYEYRADSNGKACREGLPVCTPNSTENGNHFVGWYTDPTGGERITDNTKVTTETSHILYAHYKTRNRVDEVVPDVETSDTDITVVTEGTRISLLTKTPGATIFYSTKKNPDMNDYAEYTDAVIVSKDMAGSDQYIYLSAYAEKEDYITSEIKKYKYELKNEDADWGDSEFIMEDAADEGYDTPGDLPKGLWIGGVDSKYYTGEAITWDLHVYDNKTLLKEGTDYSVKYKNNVNAGIATITVTGKGNYSGKIVKSARILTASIATIEHDYQLPRRDKENELNNIAKVTVYGANGKVLKVGKDYNLEYVYGPFAAPLVINGGREIQRKIGEAVDKKDIVLRDITIIINVIGIGNYADSRIAGTYELVENANFVDISKADIKLPSHEYDGTSMSAAEVRDALIITYNGETLRPQYDYDVFTYGQVGPAAGKYSILIRGTGDYYNTVRKEVTISQIKIKEENLIFGESGKTVTYTGKHVIPDPFSVECNGKTLEEGVDYTLSSKNDVKPAGASGKKAPVMTVKGIGNYTGSVSVKYAIEPGSIETCTVVFNDAVKGSANWKADVIVTDIFGNVLTKKDYGIKYEISPEDESFVNVVITGKGCYTGEVFTGYILNNPMDISYATINDILSKYEYVKGGVKPEFSVTYGIDTLIEGVDYKVEYVDYDGIGDGQVIVRGIGTYTGATQKFYKIVPGDISKLNISASDVIYSNKAGKYKSAPVVKDVNGKVLKSGLDYENITYYYADDTILKGGVERNKGDVIGSKDIPPAGTLVRVEVTGKGKYTGTLTSTQATDTPYTYRIAKASVSKAKITVSNQAYTGKAVTPGKDSLVVKVGKTTLTKNDYEITGYSNNVKKGTAKITITGKSDYTGTKTVNFKITDRTMLYTIIFNGNGADSGSMKKQTVVAESIVKLSNFGYKKKNHIAARPNCWNTEPDGSGTPYSANAEIENEVNNGETLILYAQWEAVPDVTYIKVSNPDKAADAFTKQKLYWEENPYASSYVVYRATSKNGSYKKIGTTTKTYFTSTKLSAGKTYWYKVVAVAGEKVGSKKISVSGRMPSAADAVPGSTYKKTAITVKKKGHTVYTTSISCDLNLKNGTDTNITVLKDMEYKGKLDLLYALSRYQTPNRYNGEIFGKVLSGSDVVEAKDNESITLSFTMPYISIYYYTLKGLKVGFYYTDNDLVYECSVDLKGKVTIKPVSFYEPY